MNNQNFVEKTLSSLVKQQMNISNSILQRQESCHESNPIRQNVAFHSWEEYKRLGLKWGEPIVIVKIKDYNVFYLEYINGKYEEKGIVFEEEKKLEIVKRMQIFLMNKEKNFGHQEGFPIPMKKNHVWYSL
jgi:DNA modification methylase